jgi:hypothetical protein
MKIDVPRYGGKLIAVIIQFKETNVPTYVFMYVCMYLFMYVCMYLCMYVCMYICIYVCRNERRKEWKIS